MLRVHGGDAPQRIVRVVGRAKVLLAVEPERERHGGRLHERVGADDEAAREAAAPVGDPAKADAAKAALPRRMGRIKLLKKVQKGSS